MEKFAGTLRKYYSGILAFIDTQLTNAISESLNRIVKIVKNRTSGFRALNAFTDMIYLVAEDVDIPVQISSGFRAF